MLSTSSSTASKITPQIVRENGVNISTAASTDISLEKVASPSHSVRLPTEEAGGPSDCLDEPSLQEGSRVEIYFKATITKYDAKRKKPFYILYDDGDREWISFRNERFRVLEERRSTRQQHNGAPNQFSPPTRVQEEVARRVEPACNTTSGDPCTDGLHEGSRVEIYWEGEQQYFKATIKKYDAKRVKPFYVLYDDGDHEWMSFRNERFRILESIKGAGAKDQQEDLPDQHSPPSPVCVDEVPPVEPAHSSVETSLSADSGMEVLHEGSRVEIYWEGEQQYFKATIKKYDAKRVKPFYILYDDGDHEWVSFRNERFRVLGSNKGAGAKEQQEDLPDQDAPVPVHVDEVPPVEPATLETSLSADSCMEVLHEGSRVEIYWEGEEQYFKATIKKYDAKRVKPFYVLYEDGDHEWVSFRNERFRILREESGTKAKEQQEDLHSKIEFDELGSRYRKDVPWDCRMKELVAYRQKHGHCNVSTNYSELPRLGMWVQNQRRQYSLMKRGKPSHITKERVAALDEIGFSWQRRPLWLDRFRELREFKKEMGHCKVTYTDTGFGRWVARQNSLLRKLENGEPTSLSTEQVEMLRAIGLSGQLKRCRSGSVSSTEHENSEFSGALSATENENSESSGGLSSSETENSDFSNVQQSQPIRKRWKKQVPVCYEEMIL